MQPLISFKDFKLWNAEKVFYEKINFDLFPGDKYIFLGPNGSGKTLLMEILQMGISREMAHKYGGLQASGSILDSEGNNLLIPSKDNPRKIAYVSQFANFFENTTVKDQILSECSFLCEDVSESEMDELLHSFDSQIGLKHKIKGHLSGGEEKIVQLVAGIIKARRANVLLLDEPLNHLAFKNSAKFNAILKEEIRNNPSLAIIMVTHCRAMDFANREIHYDHIKEQFIVSPYASYDCFSISKKEARNC